MKSCVLLPVCTASSTASGVVNLTVWPLSGVAQRRKPRVRTDENDIHSRRLTLTDHADMLEGFPADATINESLRSVMVSMSPCVIGSSVLLGCADEEVGVAETVVELADAGAEVKADCRVVILI